MLDTIKRRLRQQSQRLDRLDSTIPGKATDRLKTWRDDPALLMADAGMKPDPWQAELLRSLDPKILVTASRQVGKSRTTAFLALHQALTVAGSTTVLVAPVEDQASELLRKVIESYHALGDPVPVKREAVTRLELMNGSRVIALPGKETRMRSFTTSLLIVDEAARVPDEVFMAASPTLAVTKGRIIAISSAFAKSGFFYDEWTEGNGRRFKVTAHMCPRISREFLESERRVMGRKYWEMEYFCEFSEANGALFSKDDIDAMETNRLTPLVFDFMKSQDDNDSSVKPLEFQFN